jgi:type I restriction enzyme S subunit
MASAQNLQEGYAMTAVLRPYPEYKNSRLPSLSQVPSHWDLLRIKHFLKEVDIRSKTGEQELLSMRQQRGFVRHNDVSEKRFKQEDLIGFKQVEPGQLVMNRMRASIGLFASPQEAGLVSPDYAVFQPTRDIDLEYLIQLFKSPGMCARFRVESKGLGTGESGFLRLYTDRFGAIPIALPPLEEQESIVRFINELDKLINCFIRNRRRLIEVLNEQKQAIINRAVTRGLDPNVRLKPSGVEWLGDIPEHWEAHRLRRIATVRLSSVDKVMVEGEVAVRLCNYVDVYKNDTITGEIDFMLGSATESEIRSFQLRAGDVLITKDSEEWEDIAVPAFVPKALKGVVCGYHLAVIRPYQDLLDGEYLARAFTAESVAIQFRVASNGVTRYGLPQEGIKGAFFPVPPLAEQRQIAVSISEQCCQIASAISKAEREIGLIRDYRTRLFADVVTGKVDVRQLAPSEPIHEEEIGKEEDPLDGTEEEEMLNEDGAELAEEAEP